MEGVLYICDLVRNSIVLSYALPTVLCCFFTGEVFHLWCVGVPVDTEVCLQLCLGDCLSVYRCQSCWLYC